MRDIIIALLTLLSSLAAALPASSLTPRCGTFLAPDGFYVLDEAAPDAYWPLDKWFYVAQQAGTNGGRATARKYLLVHFPATPSGSYGCQLQWVLPNSVPLMTSYGSTQLDVKTTTGYYPPFRPTWNTIVKNNEGTLGQGVWGTVNAVTGAGPSTVNTATCSNAAAPPNVGGGFGLGFVFKYADWVEQGGQAAAVAFSTDGGSAGPYLNYNC